MTDDVQSLANSIRDVWCADNGALRDRFRAIARYILENFDPTGAAEKRPEDTRWQLGPCTYANGESGRIVCLDRQYEDGEHGYPILSVSDKGKVIPHRQDGIAWANPLFNLKGNEDTYWVVENVSWDAILPPSNGGPLRLKLFAFGVDPYKFSPGQCVHIVPVE